MDRVIDAKVVSQHDFSGQDHGNSGAGGMVMICEDGERDLRLLKEGRGGEKLVTGWRGDSIMRV